MNQNMNSPSTYQFQDLPRSQADKGLYNFLSMCTVQHIYIKSKKVLVMCQHNCICFPGRSLEVTKWKSKCRAFQKKLYQE